MTDTDYLMQRSHAEAVRAIEAAHPSAAAIHQELCLLYVARALVELLGRRATP